MPPYSVGSGTASGAPPRIDPELIRSAVTGDQTAISGLLRRLEPMVFRYCAGRLGSWQDGSADAEDCAQEVLLAVLSALPGYRYEVEGFLGFVFGIAAHKVSDAFRRRARDKTSPVAEPPTGAWQGMDPTVDEVERSAALDWSTGLLDTLPERQREILVLRIILGLSAEETAQAVGLSSAGAVRVAQHRALNSLRRALRERGRP